MQNNAKVKAINIDSFAQKIAEKLFEELFIYDEEPILDVYYDDYSSEIQLLAKGIKKDRLEDIIYDIIEDYKDDYVISYKVIGDLK
jgi:hypothetical protein